MKDVLIVGGGVAGLSASLALAQAGLSSLVLEATQRRGEIDRGDVLHAYAMRILEEWDAARALFASGALRISRFKITDNSGQVLQALDTTQHIDPPADLVSLRHPIIERSLEETAIRTGRVQVEHGVRCSGLVREGGRVVGAKTNQGDFRAPLTVMAAGTSSGLVDAEFPTTLKVRYGVSFYSMRCGFISSVRDSGVYAIGPRGVLAIAPLPDNETRVVIQLSQPCAIPTGEEMDEALRIRGLSFHGTLPLLRGHLYHAVRHIARPFWHPGVVLIGDAAHTTHPVGGQGMNLAIRGAKQLGDALGRIGDLSPQALDYASRDYERMMRDVAHRTLRLTHLLGTVAASDRLRGACRYFLSSRRLAVGLLSRICWGM